MISIRAILLPLCISFFTLCSVEGMEASLLKSDIELLKTCINLPYLIAKIGTILIDDTDSSTDSSQEEADTELESSLIQRKIVTSVISSLRLGAIPLTINAHTILLKELCDPHALSLLLHTMHRDSSDAHSKNTFAHYIMLLNKSLKWDSLEKVLPKETSSSFKALMQKTESSTLEEEGYRFLFETLAMIGGFSLKTDLHHEALSALCKDIAHHKTPTFESVLACFIPASSKNRQEAEPPKNRYIQALIGCLCFTHECAKDKKAACRKLFSLYASLSEPITPSNEALP